MSLKPEFASRRKNPKWVDKCWSPLKTTLPLKRTFKQEAATSHPTPFSAKPGFVYQENLQKGEKKVSHLKKNKQQKRSHTSVSCWFLKKKQKAERSHTNKRPSAPCKPAAPTHCGSSQAMRMELLDCSATRRSPPVSFGLGSRVLCFGTRRLRDFPVFFA